MNVQVACPEPQHLQVLPFSTSVPEGTAVRCGAVDVSFGELQEHACNMRTALAEQGIGAADRVAVLLPPSLESIALLIALLELGAVYVPLSITQPTALLDAQAHRCGVCLLLYNDATAVLAAALPRQRSQHVLQLRARGTTQPAALLPDAAPACIMHTSGSTGSGKSVLLSRGNLVAMCSAVRKGYTLAAEDRVLHRTPLSFDVSLEEVLPALQVGACICLPDDCAQDPLNEMDTCIRTQQISVVNVATPLWAAWVMHNAGRAAPSTLRLVIIGSDACTESQVRAWQRLAWPRVRCLNAYGLTETTVTNAVWELPSSAAVPWSGPVPIGQGLPGNVLRILGPQGRPVPRGQAGELHISGPQVAEGYLGGVEPELQARFQRAGTDAMPCLRTGDLGQQLPSGDILLAGRSDRQFKIAGHRIEPRAVELALESLKGIRRAIVVAAGPPQQRQVFAYIEAEGLSAVARDDSVRVALHPQLAALMAPLAALLPAPARPTVCRLMDRLPTTANGKVDVRALPPPDLEQATHAAALQTAAPGSRLAQVQRVMGQVDATQAFFEAGGDSIIALHVLAALRQGGWQLPMVELLGAPSLEAALARCTPVDLCAAPERARPFICGLDLDLSELAALRADRTRWNATEFLCAANPLQLGMIEAARQQPGNGICIEQVEGLLLATELDGFAERWQQLVRRHDALRTSFRVRRDGRLYLACSKEVSLDWGLEDWRHLDPDVQNTHLADWLAEDRRLGFAMDGRTPSRWRLFQLADDRWHFVWTYHHALLDGWSDVRLLQAALAPADESGQPVPSTAATSYRDHVLWLSRQDASAAAAWWRASLSHLGRHRGWYVSRPSTRNPVWQRRTLEVGAQRETALQDCCRAGNVSLSSAYAAALARALHGLTGSPDIVFGQFIWIRPAELPELQQTAGMFMNLVPVISSGIDTLTPAQLLQHMHDQQLQRDAHAWLPHDRIAACDTQDAKASLFDVAMVFENLPLQPGSAAARMRNHAQSSLPVSLYVWPGQCPRLELVFDAARVPDTAAQALLPLLLQALDHFIAESFVHAPSESPGACNVHSTFSPRCQSMHRPPSLLQEHHGHSAS